MHHSLHKTFLQSVFMHQAQSIDHTTALLPSTDTHCITAHSHTVVHRNSLYVYLYVKVQLSYVSHLLLSLPDTC